MKVLRVFFLATGIDLLLLTGSQTGYQTPHWTENFGLGGNSFSVPSRLFAAAMRRIIGRMCDTWCSMPRR